MNDTSRTFGVKSGVFRSFAITLWVDYCELSVDEVDDLQNERWKFCDVSELLGVVTVKDFHTWCDKIAFAIERASVFGKVHFDRGEHYAMFQIRGKKRNCNTVAVRCDVAARRVQLVLE